MCILFGIVCGILCGISDLSGADTKIVRRVGNYGSEVSLSWYSHTHLQCLTGYRDNSTCTKCTFGSSGFMFCVTDVPVIQYVWSIRTNKCEHRSSAIIETLIIPVTRIFDARAYIQCDENADVIHEYLYGGSVTVRLRHSPDWNRGNACAISFMTYFWYHSSSIAQRIRTSALMYAGWRSAYLSAQFIMFRLFVAVRVPVVCVPIIFLLHMCAVLLASLIVTATLALVVVVVLMILLWTCRLIKLTILLVCLTVAATCRKLVFLVLNPAMIVYGVITLVYQFGVVLYCLGLLTMSVIGSCLCRGFSHSFKNSPSIVTCLASQLILIDVTEASNSTWPLPTPRFRCFKCYQC